MYIYRNNEVPLLNKNNEDVIRKMKKSKSRLALITVVLIIFDIFVYWLYFFNTKNTYVWYKHLLFWGIFFVLPYFCGGLYKFFTDRSFVAQISKLIHRQVYWIDRFDHNKKRATRLVVDYNLLSKNGKEIAYRTFFEENHHLVLSQGSTVVKFAGMKYVVAVNSSLPKYFICAKCGYLCDVEDLHCQRCSTSVIKIFTEDAYLDAEAEIQDKILNRESLK